MRTWFAVLAVLVASIAACGPSAPPAAPEKPSAPESSAAASEAPSSAASSSGSQAAGATGQDEEKKDDGAEKLGKVGAAAVDDKPLGGKLTQEEIKVVVEKHGELFNDCYSIGAGKSEQFVAKVTLKVTVGPTGKVNQAVVTSSTTKNPKVDQCVVDGFKKIQFPAPKDGGTTVFSFPMQFGGAVQVQ